MSGVHILIFLVSCSQSLLLCEDRSNRDLRFESMADCQAELPTLIEKARATGAEDQVVMAKCRYRLAGSDRPRGQKIR